MKTTKCLSILVATVLVALVPGEAFAGRYGKIYGFRTSSCKTSSCYAKHPSGHYVHPLTHRRRH